MTRGHDGCGFERTSGYVFGSHYMAGPPSGMRLMRSDHVSAGDAVEYQVDREEKARKDIVLLMAHQRKYAFLPVMTKRLVRMLHDVGWPESMMWKPVLEALARDDGINDAVVRITRSSKGDPFEVYFP